MRIACRVGPTAALFLVVLSAVAAAQDTKNEAKDTKPAAAKPADAPVENVKSAALSLADVIERSEPACVRLDLTLRDGRAIGSGFIINDKCWAITNHHVVAGSTKAVASFFDGTTADVEGCLAFDEKRDLAVIKLKIERKLPMLPLAKGTPRKGENTIAIGAPQGLSFTATEGIVSAIREGAELKSFGKDAMGTWLQTSTPISPGSSGGPLLNMLGEVVGANSGGIASAQNLNFAISAKDIAEMIEIAAKAKLQNLSTIPPLVEPRRPGRPSRSGEPEPAAGPPITVKLPATRKFKHTWKIAQEDDKFDKIRWLRTDWMPLKHNDRRLVSCALRISAPFRPDEPPPVVLWEVQTASPSFVFLRDRTFQILVDDDSHDLGDARHNGDVGRGGVSETLTSIVPLNGFVETSFAKSAKARVGALEYELSAMHLECFRDFASRLPTGTTTIGNMQVERYSPEDDPSAGGAKKPKAVANAKPGDAKPADPKPADGAGDAEKQAASKLRLAKQLLDIGRKTAAKERLEQIVKDFAGTAAAKEAEEMLKKL